MAFDPSRSQTRAFCEGVRYGQLHSSRPCLRCIRLIRGRSHKNAESFASGFHEAVCARGRHPETQCECVSKISGLFLS